MAKTKGPLLSLQASKQLGKAITFKTYGNRSVVTRYTTPGDVQSYEPTTRQHTIRDAYRQLFAEWQNLSQAEKQTWIENASEKSLTLSGWNLFYKSELPEKIAEINAVDSIFGTRVYGNFAYAKQS